MFQSSHCLSATLLPLILETCRTVPERPIALSPSGCLTAVNTYRFALGAFPQQLLERRFQSAAYECGASPRFGRAPKWEESIEAEVEGARKEWFY
jgi:hypothetical protein